MMRLVPSAKPMSGKVGKRRERYEVSKREGRGGKLVDLRPKMQSKFIGRASFGKEGNT